ncbi:GNAT family N-acetyltransferase [Roseobacter sp. YSTF-M11]|uniref:GNAT family N-acetyltransferase n=1 Tax=Roseobacter insulae TaxID=2859783 RepID=A0A9X1K3E8_9RHOB|nr:GNAT family N-acetyltransferase [Roseobacter insulae]MBW4709498.1 GNAT family N-acetyltransferase [Roseobacter insulae]
MTVTVRLFCEADADAFLAVHRACLVHYGIEPATNAQEARLLSLLVAERHMACHLAFDDALPVGFATWGLNFPAGAGVSLVMKELFVRSGARKKGVGRALLSALIDVARDEGCTRFDWATDGSNDGSQQFYASLAAPKMTKQNYRVPRTEFDAFQARIDQK